MYDEKEYKQLAQEWINDIRIEGYNGDYLTDEDVSDLLWKSYEQGYQDRIDDYDGMEDTTAQDEWERTR